MGGQFCWTFCDKHTNRHTDTQTHKHTDTLTDRPSYIAALGAAKTFLAAASSYIGPTFRLSVCLSVRYVFEMTTKEMPPTFQCQKKLSLRMLSLRIVPAQECLPQNFIQDFSKFQF